MSDSRTVNSKEHSFFISFLAHSINLWTLYSFVLAKYLDITRSLYPGLLILVVTFVMGYLVYFRGGRAEKLIKREVTHGMLALNIVFAVSYVLVSVYLMIYVGDYVRKIHSEA